MFPGPSGTPRPMAPPSVVPAHQDHAAGSRSNHELLLTESSQDAATRLGDRVRESLDQGTRVLLALDRALADTVFEGLDPVPDGTSVTRIPPARRETRPSSVLTQMLQRVREESSSGRSVLLVHRPPSRGERAWWDWARVEAAVNLLLPTAVSGLCVYERPRLSEDQARQMLATHPVLDDGDGTRANPSYRDADELLRSAADDGVPEPGDPDWVLVAPSLPETRRAVRLLARATEVRDGDVQALLFAVTEVLANARTHGRGPVTVRLFASERRLVVGVGDAGSGPDEPLAGLVRLGDGSGTGDGLWLAHAIADVRHHRSADGYTVYVSVGED
jgi:anti-sigma regulatory factor (Ser/Thr protein kinase)